PAAEHHSPGRYAPAEFFLHIGRRADGPVFRPKIGRAQAGDLGKSPSGQEFKRQIDESDRRSLTVDLKKGHRLGSLQKSMKIGFHALLRLEMDTILWQRMLVLIKAPLGMRFPISVKC